MKNEKIDDPEKKGDLFLLILSGNAEDTRTHTYIHIAAM